MMYSLAVALGGAFGAVSRYWMVSVVSQFTGARVHWGTFAVNVIGSFMIGAMYVVISEKLLLSEQWRALLVVGYLGAFTTFSTFSLDTLLLIQEGMLAQALFYMAGSVAICLLAAWAGMSVLRII